MVTKFRGNLYLVLLYAAAATITCYLTYTEGFSSPLTSVAINVFTWTYKLALFTLFWRLASNFVWNAYHAFSVQPTDQARLENIKRLVRNLVAGLVLACCICALSFTVYAEVTENDP